MVNFLRPGSGNFYHVCSSCGFPFYSALEMVDTCGPCSRPAPQEQADPTRDQLHEILRGVDPDDAITCNNAIDLILQLFASGKCYNCGATDPLVFDED